MNIPQLSPISIPFSLFLPHLLFWILIIPIDIVNLDLAFSMQIPTASDFSMNVIFMAFSMS